MVSSMVEEIANDDEVSGQRCFTKVELAVHAVQPVSMRLKLMYLLLCQVMSNIRVVLAVLPPYHAPSSHMHNPTFPIQYYECSRDAYVPSFPIFELCRSVLLSDTHNTE
jgi:hypothetical protein